MKISDVHEAIFSHEENLATYLEEKRGEAARREVSKLSNLEHEQLKNTAIENMIHWLRDEYGEVMKISDIDSRTLETLIKRAQNILNDESLAEFQAKLLLGELVSRAVIAYIGSLNREVRNKVNELLDSDPKKQTMDRELYDTIKRSAGKRPRMSQEMLDNWKDAVKMIEEEADRETGYAKPPEVILDEPFNPLDYASMRFLSSTLVKYLRARKPEDS